MAVNDKQKIILFDIVPDTVTQIQTKLTEGYVIQFIVSLLPKYEKILVVYSTPVSI